MCSSRDERSTRAGNRQPNSAIQEIARRRMAKQMSQASLAAQQSQLDSTASENELDQQHQSRQPTAAALLYQAGMAPAHDRAGPALVHLTRGSDSGISTSAEAIDVLRGDTRVNAIALEDDVSEDGLGPADPAALVQLQRHQGEPRRLNRLRRAGSPRLGSSAASSTAGHEPADAANASIAGLVSGFGSLQVKCQPILQTLFHDVTSWKESVHSHCNVLLVVWFCPHRSLAAPRLGHLHSRRLLSQQRQRCRFHSVQCPCLLQQRHCRSQTWVQNPSAANTVQRPAS